jgi:glycosyltransferase involved in cell wall biosynthesis
LKPTKIVHLTSVHPTFDIRIFHKECKSLARSGCEVTLIAPHEKDEVVDGVRIRAIPKARGRLHRMTITVWRVYREALRQAGDIYHLHDPELLAVGVLLKARGKRVIYDAHEDLPRTIQYKSYLPRWLQAPLRWMAEHLENRASKLFVGVVAATPMIAERFKAVNPRTVSVCNFPITAEFLTLPHIAWENRDFSVAYIGGLTKQRGICEIVRAMDQLPDSIPARLALAGKFLPQELQGELVNSSGWDRVDFLGFLDRDKLAALLGTVRAGLVILHPEPNYVCSLPIKLFEYMCAGIPVIASDFPLWRRIVNDAECGLLVDPLDPKAIADAIAYLLSHPKESEVMGNCGRAAVQRNYTWSQEEQKLLHLYGGIGCRLLAPVQPAPSY